MTTLAYYVSGHGWYHPDGPRPTWDDETDHLIGGEGSDILVGFGGRDYYTGNDDGGDVDTLYVTPCAGTATDIVRS